MNIFLLLKHVSMNKYLLVVDLDEVRWMPQQRPPLRTDWGRASTEGFVVPFSSNEVRIFSLSSRVFLINS
jgi:hypothetical protein